MKYNVDNLIDNTYQVREYITLDEWQDGKEATVYFQGSLSDCEAFIRLKNMSDVDF